MTNNALTKIQIYSLLKKFLLQIPDMKVESQV